MYKTNKIVEKFLTGFIIGLMFLVLIGVGYGSWILQRRINYKLSYNALVQESIDKTIAEHINKYHKE